MRDITETKWRAVVENAHNIFFFSARRLSAILSCSMLHKNGLTFCKQQPENEASSTVVSVAISADVTVPCT